MALTRREFISWPVVMGLTLKKCGNNSRVASGGESKPETITELDKRGEFVFEDLTKWFASEEFKFILEKKLHWSRYSTNSI